MKTLLTKITQIVTPLLICLTMACQQRRTETITQEQARTMIDGFLKFRNEGDLAAADEVMHPECVIRYPNLPQDIVGLDAYKEYDRTTRIAFPDFKLAIDDFFVKDDRIFSYWTLTATHAGPLKGPMGELPPTNKKVHISGVAISRVADGKIIEDVAYFDMLDLLQQLGFKIVPPNMKNQE